MTLLKRLLFFVPVLCGIVLFFTLVKNKEGPVRPEITERQRPVKVVQVQAMSIIPRVTGFGYVQPTETWRAIPEVGGRVVEVHPELKRGAFIAKGDLLIRIDAKSYGLAERRGQATMVTVEAKLKELEQQRENTGRLLEIEQDRLKLAQQELLRKRELYRRGFISLSEMELEEKNQLVQERAIKNLHNILDLIPPQKTALLARKDSDASSLSELQLDLEKTVIRAPFNCRISEVNVELNQYAGAGTTLLKVINISAVEIPVKLAPKAFSHLLSESSVQQSINVSRLNMDEIRKMIGISATVRLPMFGREVRWDARFMRTSESIDLSTGALTVYVSVQHPFERIIPSVRPPLVPNMYCEVELQGQKRDGRFVVPVHAVHGEYVYVVDQQERLLKKSVVVEMMMSDFAVIYEGLDDNDRVVTTDLVPAIEGMLLAPVLDKVMTERLRAQGVDGAGEIQP